MCAGVGGVAAVTNMKKKSYATAPGPLFFPSLTLPPSQVKLQSPNQSAGQRCSTPGGRFIVYLSRCEAHLHCERWGFSVR